MISHVLPSTGSYTTRGRIKYGARNLINGWSKSCHPRTVSLVGFGVVRGEQMVISSVGGFRIRQSGVIHRIFVEPLHQVTTDIFEFCGLEEVDQRRLRRAYVYEQW